MYIFDSDFKNSSNHETFWQKIINNILKMFYHAYELNNENNSKKLLYIIVSAGKKTWLFIDNIDCLAELRLVTLHIGNRQV